MTIQEKIEVLKSLPEVASVSVWKGKRAYINLTACDKSFRGNCTHQFYLDMVSGEIVDRMGKGTTSRAFDEARATAAAAIAD